MVNGVGAGGCALRDGPRAQHRADEVSLRSCIAAHAGDTPPARPCRKAARAHGMARIAQATGRSRESLYRALSNRGNPQLATFMGVLRASGLELSIRPAGSRAG
ncbi:addiction module antidote protein [Methylobacterium sp. E-041]|uniref:addiction module antidote protein n=1 Tax=Methylobacterium sp. E-041 TaxID=2836573 RepID=UPI0028BE8183|nr:addiction module antidote protein [Methylobacterium sp. E-041]